MNWIAVLIIAEEMLIVQLIAMAISRPDNSNVRVR